MTWPPPVVNVARNTPARLVFFLHYTGLLGIVEALKPAGGRCPVTCWYVASLADGDTHLAELAPDAHLVTAHCDGRPFRPSRLCTQHQNHDDTNRKGR